MRHIFAIFLILALLLPAQRPLTCRQHTNGQCQCYTRSRGVGLGWKARPALWCYLAEVGR